MAQREDGVLNLHEDITEMFAAYSGHDRYMDQLERFCEEKRLADREYNHEYRRRESQRTYHRDYCRRRYQSSAAYRISRKEATDRYKDRVLGMDRKRRFYGPIAITHGTYYAYARGGCRCVECRRASAAYQRARRASLRRAR